MADGLWGKAKREWFVTFQISMPQVLLRWPEGGTDREIQPCVGCPLLRTVPPAVSPVASPLPAASPGRSISTLPCG